jgi:hypothetical protein
MGGRRRRERVEPTKEWEQLALLCRWPEQLAYEEIRPLTLFGGSVAERAQDRHRRAHPLPQGGPLRGGGRGEPLRLGGGQAQEASLGSAYVRRGGP